MNLMSIIKGEVHDIKNKLLGKSIQSLQYDIHSKHTYKEHMFLNRTIR